MVQGGISLEGRTELHALANSILCREFLDDGGTDVADWPSGPPDLTPTLRTFGQYFSISRTTDYPADHLCLEPRL